jgi:7-cyano-7-deazaguanine reductase
VEREDLKHLRPDGTAYPQALDPGLLDTFANPAPRRSYRIRFETAEVTSLCPVTDQPDFYRVTVDYVPNRRCLESKSLKLYFVSFRNAGLFAEAMANRILDDLFAACAPRWMKVHCLMNPRGGIALEVTAQAGELPSLAGDSSPEEAGT